MTVSAWDVFHAFCLSNVCLLFYVWSTGIHWDVHYYMRRIHNVTRIYLWDIYASMAS